MGSTSIAHEDRSATHTVTDAGLVIPWPVDDGGNFFETIELEVEGATIFVRTGIAPPLVGGDVVTKLANPSAHDRRLKINTIIPDFGRKRFAAGITPEDTHLAMRTEATQIATVTVNPGV